MTNDNIPNTTESIQLLQEIAENTAKQVSLQKKNLFWNRISSALTLLTFALIVGVLYSIAPTLSTFTENANELILELSDLVEDVTEITEQLQHLDLETTLNEINTLVTESSEKISSLDIDTLNTAINDLSATVAPFAALFGR
ncbi:MAG: hypothetical protein R3Y24_04600 [Eubacteriales bacterium]